MPNTDAAPVARKVLPIIYVLDTSGSMAGEKIAKVNEAMNETFDVLKEVSADNADAEIKINVLSFSSGAEWIYSSLISLEDYYWNDLKAGGLTDVGDALKELNEKLSRSSMLVSSTGFCIPVIIFMSDGAPTDNWEKALLEINQNNKWFSHATKIAFAVGDDADKDILAQVVGRLKDGTIVPNTEAVIQTKDVETLKKLIKVVSTTASMVNSKSRTTSAGDNIAKEIVEQAIVDVQPGGKDALTPKPAPSPSPADSFNKEDAWDNDDSTDWT